MAWTGTALPLHFSSSFVLQNEYGNVCEVFRQFLLFCYFMHIDVSLLVDESLQANYNPTLFLFVYMNSLVRLVY
jgi:hypothetical protein